MSTHLLEKLLESYPGWESAIADAEQQASDCEQRAIRLHAVADVFRKKRASGESWPGTQFEDHKTASATQN